MSGIVTDLNDRERKAYGDKFEAIAKYCSELATALRAGDDTKALIRLVAVSMAGKAIHELSDIFMGSVPLDVPDHAPEDKPS